MPREGRHVSFPDRLVGFSVHSGSRHHFLTARDLPSRHQLVPGRGRGQELRPVTSDRFEDRFAGLSLRHDRTLRHADCDDAGHGRIVAPGFLAGEVQARAVRGADVGPRGPWCLGDCTPCRLVPALLALRKTSGANLRSFRGSPGISTCERWPKCHGGKSPNRRAPDVRIGRPRCIHSSSSGTSMRGPTARPDFRLTWRIPPREVVGKAEGRRS